MSTLLLCRIVSSLKLESSSLKREMRECLLRIFLVLFSTDKVQELLRYLGTGREFCGLAPFSFLNATLFGYWEYERTSAIVLGNKERWREREGSSLYTSELCSNQTIHPDYKKGFVEITFFEF